jgi:cysteine-S-conjugate beta-lyase
VTFRTLPLDVLRGRRSDKWRKFPDDVLPSHIAEMDFAVAPPIEEALVAAVRAGDLGYQHARSSGLGESFVAFAERRWGWRRTLTASSRSRT